MVQLYVAAQLRDQIRAARRAYRCTLAELVTAAVNETAAEMAAGYQQQPAMRLFADDYGRFSRARPGAAASTSQVGIRLDEAAITKIDQLVSSSSAPSRTAYIVEALRLFLASNPPPQVPS